MIVMLSELAAVVAGGDARDAALRADVGDGFEADAHGVGDGFGRQAVDDDFEDRERVGRRVRSS